MAEFDYEAAKRAGVTDEDVISLLSSKLNFDLDKAREDKVSDDDILSSLLSRTTSNPNKKFFKRIEPRLNELEGGYSPPTKTSDRGGETYRGISRKWWPGWKGWEVIDRLKKEKKTPAIDDLELAPLVEDFYSEHFIAKLPVDKLPYSIVEELFESSIHAGVKEGSKFFQKALNKVSKQQVVPDGVLGPETLKVFDELPQINYKKLYLEQNKEQKEHFRKIVEEDPGQEVNLPGWLRRIDKNAALFLFPEYETKDAFPDFLPIPEKDTTLIDSNPEDDQGLWGKITTWLRDKRVMPAVVSALDPITSASREWELAKLEVETLKKGEDFDPNDLETRKKIWERQNSFLKPLTISGFIYDYNYDKNLEAVGGDPDAARRLTIETNARNIAHTSLDLAAFSRGGLLYGGLRKAFGQEGLKAAVGAGAGEGAAYLAIHDGTAAQIAGDSAEQIVQEMLVAAAAGGAGGAVLGAGTHGIAKVLQKYFGKRLENLARARQNELIEQKNAAEFHEVVTDYQGVIQTLKNEVPGASDEVIERTAQAVHNKFITAEKAIENLKLDPSDVPVPPKTPKAGDKPDIHNPAMTPDEETNRLWQNAEDEILTSPRPVTRGAPSSYDGLPELYDETRAISGEDLTASEWRSEVIRKLRMAFSPYAAGLKEKFHDIEKRLVMSYLQTEAGIPGRSALVFKERVYDFLQGSKKEVGTKAAKLNDYITALDKLSEMTQRLKTLQGRHRDVSTMGPPQSQKAFDEIQELAPKIQLQQKQVNQLAVFLRNNPDVLQAYKGWRGLVDEMFATSVRYGLLPAGQHRQHYAPTKQLNSMGETFAQMFEGTKLGKELSAAHARGKWMFRDTGALELLYENHRALYTKIAQERLIVEIFTNPKTNRTKEWVRLPGDSGLPPKGFEVWYPGINQPGFQLQTPSMISLMGALKGLNIPVLSTEHGAGILVTKNLARKLNMMFMRPVSRMDKIEHFAYDQTQKVARQLTLYNPKNFVLNAMSDPLVALMGLPGEKADPVGFFKFLPTAIKETVKGIYREDSPIFNRAIQEGVVTPAMIEGVAGRSVPRSLEVMFNQGKKIPKGKQIKDALRAHATMARQSIETYPRIAAGLAAEARSGLKSDFGRVGAQATLHFGPGDPEITRVPIARMLAPFWRWMGLATERVYKLSTTKGSRGRALSIFAGIPVGTVMWNMQNEAYRQVEYGLKPWQRDSMHFILPDPSDPTKPWIRKGKPVIWMMRFNVFEEVLGFFGLSNMPGQLFDLATGYTTPKEFFWHKINTTGESIISSPVAFEIGQEVFTGKDQTTGEDLSFFDRTARPIPILYHSKKIFENMVNEGPNIPEYLVGIMQHTSGRNPFIDNKIKTLMREHREAKARMKTAAIQGKITEYNHWKRKAITTLQKLHSTTKGKRKQLEFFQKVEKDDE